MAPAHNALLCPALCGQPPAPPTPCECRSGPAPWAREVRLSLAWEGVSSGPPLKPTGGPTDRDHESVTMQSGVDGAEVECQEGQTEEMQGPKCSNMFSRNTGRRMIFPVPLVPLIPYKEQNIFAPFDGWGSGHLREMRGDMGVRSLEPPFFRVGRLHPPPPPFQTPAMEYLAAPSANLLLLRPSSTPGSTWPRMRRRTWRRSRGVWWCCASMRP